MQYTLYQVARQLCICLYWVKFNEDRTVYFDKVVDLQSKVKKAINGELNRPMNAEDELSMSSESQDSDSDIEEADGVNKLAEFLLDYYRGLTPHIFDKNQNKILKRCDRKLNGVSADKFFNRLSFALENVDEFVIFKKFLVTSLN